jgi:hypothetical protein
MLGNRGGIKLTVDGHSGLRRPAGRHHLLPASARLRAWGLLDVAYLAGFAAVIPPPPRRKRQR